ncbi:GAF domain-containing protein [Hymenobacter sp. DG25A]|uniref:GAF domain-containing protein n=1 Tax=Hymenobacter sp. DG25A TaxID=1385663 RepID=UPI0006BDF910|nr:GAF domain-containing protein [Hymenobacter sp. DG25A]ALD20549.1 serine/threonine protein phosphatase [Hymenobacter sp. DG25A]
MNNAQTETARITALKRYDILDTPADGTFDRMTALAAKVFNMPIVIISLVDTDRIWFKSHYGVEVQQIDRVPGLCSSAVLSHELYIVEDARQDPRALANPLVVGELGLGFYAAAPLTTHDGHNLGTFCIIDQKPRYLTDAQKLMLQDMAAIVMDEIELRLAVRTAIGENAQRTAELRKFREAVAS